MNLSELKALVSTLVADSSNNFYTEAERILAINNACSYLNSEVRILIASVQIPVTAIDQSVPIPADFVSLGHGASWVDQNNQATLLESASPKQLDVQSTGWETSVGTPQYLIPEGGRLYLSPTPSQAGTLSLSYLCMPNKLLNDTDTPFYGDVRTQAYHDAIAYYAAWQLCLKDRDFEAAQQFMQYFQSRLIDLKENLRYMGGTVQTVWADTYATS